MSVQIKILFFFCGIAHPQLRVLYLRPGAQYFKGINISSDVLFQAEISDILGISQNRFFSLGVIVPRVATTASITIIFAFHIFSSSSFHPCYFSSFSYYFFPVFLSLAITISIISANFSFCLLLWYLVDWSLFILWMENSGLSGWRILTESWTYFPRFS